MAKALAPALDEGKKYGGNMMRKMEEAILAVKLSARNAILAKENRG